jgi:hypothetical protein
VTDLLDARAVLRIGCEHPAPVNITTLASPVLQYLCSNARCAARWEHKRDTSG